MTASSLTPPSRRLRRGLVAPALAVALLAAGCSGEPAAAGAPQATERCDPVEYPSLQFGSHLIGDARPPVPYSSTPPTSGWHASGAPPIGAFEQAVADTQQVSTLEAGGVVVTYNDLPEADLDALTAVLSDALRDRVVLSPYNELPEGTVAMASWGAVQRCDGLDVDAVATYVATFANAVDTHG